MQSYFRNVGKINTGKEIMLKNYSLDFKNLIPCTLNLIPVPGCGNG
jgi:hypothetical protein